jgi:energy-coupling factor transporter ATP-binding protein EcfA2
MAQFRFNYDTMLLCGRSGSGKTTFLKSIVSKTKRYVVIDTAYCFRESPQENRIRPVGFSAEALDDMLLGILKTHTNFLLVIDDIDSYSPLQSKVLNVLAVIGRHQNVGLAISSRRPLRLPKTVIANMRYIVTFAGVLGDDLDYLYQNTGIQIRAPSRMFEHYVYRTF